MKKKDELVSFIRKAAAGVEDPKEWNEFAVNHYSNESMELARREMVKQKLGYGSGKTEKEISVRLFQIASDLEGTST